MESAFFELTHTLKRFIAKFVAEPADVEDLLQDTYVKAVTGEQSTRVRNPKGYLLTVARSVALNELAKRSRRIAAAMEVAGVSPVISDDPTAEDRLLGREKLDALGAAVANLPPKCREAFILCKVYGLSYKAIAERMGISVSTVEKHMITSLKRCEAHMRAVDLVEGHEDDASDGAQPRSGKVHR